MSNSCTCRLLFAAMAVSVAVMQQAAAQTEYHGREERLEISMPASFFSNGSAPMEVVNATVFVPLPDWVQSPLVPSWVATTVGVLALIGMACVFAMMCGVALHERKDFVEPVVALIKAPRVLCKCSTENQPTLDRLKSEVILCLEMQYVITLLAILYAWARKVHQLPSSLLLLAAPWICRNLCLNCIWTCSDGYAPMEQKGCCARLVANLGTGAAILFGKFENLDAASDGLAVASAYFLSEEAQRRFALSFSSSTGLLGWFCAHLGLGNVMLAALLYATLVQGAVASIAGGASETDVAAIKALGDLGGFARVSKEDGTVKVVDLAFQRLIVGLARVCSESMLQALLQTSLVMAQGQSLFDQPVLALSICFSCTTLAVKALDMLYTLRQMWQAWREAGVEDPNDDKPVILVFSFVNLFAAIATVAVLAIILLKLYASQSCESHMWGLTTGCVDLA